MKSTEFMNEVITGPEHDAYINDYAQYFAKAPVIDSNNGLALKQTKHDDNILYGLFDQGDLTIVGILILQPYNEKYWQVVLAQIEQKYKGQGFGTYLYDYAVMNDNLSILSDSMQTKHKNGSSWQLWCSLFSHGRYTVCGYDLYSDTILPDVSPRDIETQTENIVWLAIPKGEGISEMLSRLNDPTHRSSAKYRQVVWYGPETINQDNY